MCSRAELQSHPSRIQPPGSSTLRLSSFLPISHRHSYTDRHRRFRCTTVGNPTSSAPSPAPARLSSIKSLKSTEKVYTLCRMAELYEMIGESKEGRKVSGPRRRDWRTICRPNDVGNVIDTKTRNLYIPNIIQATNCRTSIAQWG